MLVVATFVCWRTLPSDLGKRQGQNNVPERDSEPDQDPDESGKLSRIDILGASLLALFILLLLLPLEVGGEVSWSHPLIPGLVVGAAVFLVLFVCVEKRCKGEPILDLDLFKQRDVVICLLIIAFQSAAQLGVSRFQSLRYPYTFLALLKWLLIAVLDDVLGTFVFQSHSESVKHRSWCAFAPVLVWECFGRSILRLLHQAVCYSPCSRDLINCQWHRTGKYKWLIYISTISSSVCYALLLTRWHGNTNWFQSFYILPGYVFRLQLHCAIMNEMRGSNTCLVALVWE